MRSRADWSRRLPQPLVIPSLMTIRMLAEVRELMRHLPAGYPAKALTGSAEEWPHAAAMFLLCFAFGIGAAAGAWLTPRLGSWRSLR